MSSRSNPIAFQAISFLASSCENGGMVEYRTSAHAVFDIKYHVGWITKIVTRFCEDEWPSGHATCCARSAQTREVVIIRGAVSPDHIHMLVSCLATLAPAKVVQYLKGRSSRRLQDEFPELRKRYWGQHLWARGYFCASVGAVDEETIKKYIENNGR
jgi:putative transposase